MSRPIDVVAGLIVRDGRFLVCQRPAHKARGLLWEFPGGKVEPGETPAVALRRECLEELALPVDVERQVAEQVFDYPDISVHLMLLRCSTDREPALLEHCDARWITVPETAQYAFCPADRNFCAALENIFETE